MGRIISIFLVFALLPIILGIFLFLPAGTLDYWQAWLYIISLTVPMFFVLMYFVKKDQKFLERRMRTKEKETKQKSIIKFSTIIFCIGFLVPGLDIRFGWSLVPDEVSFGADLILLLGYFIVFLTFKENSYAGRTVEVEKDQKVITTGPYSMVRHPMYVGTLMMFLSTPIILGSYIALPFFLLLVPLIVLRILNEEKVLLRELKGYQEYCKKTKYRLVPFVW